MASMIDGDTDAEVTFDWDQAQKELLVEAGIDMAKEMESKLLAVAEDVSIEIFNFVLSMRNVHLPSINFQT